jgi:hypothetical protein
MYRKAQFLKWTVRLLVLLPFVGAIVNFSGMSSVAWADGDSCQLAWGTTSGNTPLDIALVPDDHGLRSTLNGYSLNCTTQTPHSHCALFHGPVGAASFYLITVPLDLSNIQTTSPWIYNGQGGAPGFTGLQGYNLWCY